MSSPDEPATPGDAVPPGGAAPAAGSLLVATPALGDPHFERAVVLVVDHDDDGALGVVLNRPSPVEVAEILPAWGPHVTGAAVVFKGGPVGTDSALAIARAGTDTAELVGFRPVAAGLGLVDLDTPAELLGPALTRMRVFAGYAGWGPGQLEDEVAADAWFVVGSEPDDAFTSAADALWRTVLRRQRGPLAWVSTAPSDPTMN